MVLITPYRRLAAVKRDILKNPDTVLTVIGILYADIFCNISLSNSIYAVFFKKF